MIHSSMVVSSRMSHSHQMMCVMHSMIYSMIHRVVHRVIHRVVHRVIHSCFDLITVDD